MKLSKLIKESRSVPPTNHRISENGQNLILEFRSEDEAERAKMQYIYDIPGTRTTNDDKGLVLPLINVTRFLVNKLQNNVYNPSTK